MASRRPHGLTRSGPIIPAGDPTGLAPLSFGQERLWFLDQLSPGNPFYNDTTIVHFRGPLDVEALRKGLARVVDRHDVLRTVYPAVNGVPVARVMPMPALDLPVVDVSDVEEVDRGAEVERRAREEVLRPLRLVTGPPLRLSLLKFGEQDNVLLITMHHIVSDAWSIGVLLRELETLYQAFSSGREDPLPRRHLQYSDFARWQRARIDQVVADQLPYWRDKLGGDQGAAVLPTDYPRPAVQSFRGSSRAVEFTPSLSEAVRALSRQERVTSFTTLLTAFHILLHHRSGSREIRVGSAVAGRRSVETEDLIGFFINTLVLRGDLSGDPTFRELLARVSDDVVDSMAHQDVPFERIVGEVNPNRGLSHNPLFQVWFNLVNTPAPRLRLPGLDVTIADAPPATARLELALILWETDGRFRGRFEFAEDLYRADTIEEMSRQYIALLNAALSQPERPVSDLTRLLARADERPGGPAPRWSVSEPTVLDQFEASVRRHPDAVAVACGNRHLTYGELDRRADRLAAELQRQGVGPDVLVAVAIGRSVELLVAIFATLKAGGAYVPLDPGYPSGHLARVLEDARPAALLTARRWLDRLPAFDGPIVDLDHDVERAPGDRAPTRAPGQPGPDHLAYVIYTSGSTGRPKGVLVSHRNLLYSTSVRSRVYPDPVSRYLLVSSSAFDSSVAGLYWTLMQAGTLILPEEGGEHDTRALIDLIRSRQITHTLMVPELYSALLEQASREDLSSLKTVILAGESCPPILTERHYERLPGTPLVNEYGPTEATVWATVHAIEAPVEKGLVPIGRPIPNTAIYLLDADGGLVSGGRPGEIYIGGPGVTRGYLRRPGLTAERFVPDPFGQDPGGRLFRTGDLARRRPDGTLEFLGRADQQVKIRGYRIELEEIRGHLAAHPDVRQAAVADRDDAAGGRRLVGYLVARPGARLTVESMRAFLERRLPAYMVPAAFVTLDALPLLPNGKVDLGALPDPGSTRPDLDQEYLAPRTPLERYLVDRWTDVLALNDIGIHDGFFAIGGTSLKAAVLANRLTQDLGDVLNVATLFQYPSIAALANHLIRSHPSLLVPVRDMDQADAISPTQARIARLSPDREAQRRVSALSDDEVRAELDRLLSGGEPHE